MRFFEIANSNDVTKLQEAMWWFQRWISGSENDPDWDESWLTHIKDFTDAFAIISSTVGNRKSIGLPLWRALELSKKQAQQIQQTMIMPVNHRSFQSFTTSREKAEMIANDVFDGFKGKHTIIVRIEIDPVNILFGIRDLKSSRNPVIKEYLLALSDWYYQDEIIVNIDKPIKISECYIIENS